MTDLQQGARIQDYILTEFISSGSTAEVWQVQDMSGQYKAIKVFSPVRGVDGHTMDLLFDEFKLTMELQHPNILKPEKLGVHGSIPYIVMPYCHGSLSGEMNRRQAIHRIKLLSGDTLFSESECLELLQQVGEGLSYLHQNNVIHQDVKPENILFIREGTKTKYVLSDFGISARLKQNIIRQTMPLQQRSAQLTPAYAAPEQFEGWIGKESDIFSLGVILFEMLTGSLPFKGTKAAGELIRSGMFPDIIEQPVHPDFKDLLYTTLQKDPVKRPTADKAVKIAERLLQVKSQKPHEFQEHTGPLRRTVKYDDDSRQSRLIPDGDVDNNPVPQTKHTNGVTIRSHIR